MLKKEQILKTLKKYGFYSLNRAPYLYQNKELIGVYFIWPNVHYGNLERVLFFEDEKLLDEEIFKYWWFLNNKNKLNVLVEFDNYKSLSPKVSYKINGIVLTSAMMKSYNEQDFVLNNEEVSLKKKQLLRTANILIMVLREKFKIQNETYYKVIELQETLKQLSNTYFKKLNQYNKSNEEVSESYELLMDESDDSEKLANKLYDDLSSLDSIEDIRSFIKSMFTYLKNIDSSNTHLQNVYLLNRYPFEIEDVKKKIEILDKAMKAKKKIFKAKNNVSELLQEVDNNSECRKMINVNLYIEKEKKRIQDKYDNHDNVDENVLGDYILNFEKLNIEVPNMIESNSIVSFGSKEEILEELKQCYEKLNKKEKSACHIAASFLRECLNCLYDVKNIDELSINELISQLILNKQIDKFNEAFQLLDNYINTNLRVKYFSILKISTFELFLESLVSVIHILDKLKIRLKYGFIGYYNNKNKEIINIGLKNSCYFEKSSSYIATILPNTPIYYSPVQIVKPLDIVDKDDLVLRENDYVFSLKHRLTIETKPEKINVIRYEKDKVVKKKDFIVIMEMKEKSTCMYYEDNISVLEGDEVL